MDQDRVLAEDQSEGFFLKGNFESHFREQTFLHERLSHGGRIEIVKVHLCALLFPMSQLLTRYG